MQVLNMLADVLIVFQVGERVLFFCDLSLCSVKNLRLRGLSMSMTCCSGFLCSKEQLLFIIFISKKRLAKIEIHKKQTETIVSVGQTYLQIVIAYYAQQKNSQQKQNQQSIEQSTMKAEANRRLDVDEGTNPFTRYGFAGQSIKNPNITTTSTDKYSFQLTPVGLGKITTLRAKFEMILGKLWFDARSIRMNRNRFSTGDYQMHPMFKYLISKVIIYDSLYKIKETQYKIDLLKELEDPSSQQQSQQQYYIKKKALIDLIEDALHDNYIKKQKMQQCNQDHSRQNRLKQYFSQISKERQKYEEQYIDILRQRFQSRNFSLYLDQQENYSVQQWKEVEILARKLCDSVDAIEPLKINQQVIRFNHFIRLNRPLFRTLKLDDKQSSYSFSIRKYSQEPEAVLHSVSDFVFLKRKEDKDKVSMGIRMQLIKDIALAVKDYEKIVPQEMEIRRLYHYLNPHNIIFDQFSLQPKVRFEPPLLEALGLTNRPISIEGRIAFFPTPQQFDFFQSLLEVHPETSRKYQLIRSDPFYGRLELHGQNIMKLGEREVAQIKRDRGVLQQEMQSILCWRFLLLSFYILNNREFGNSRKMMNEQQIRQHFVQKLVQKDRQIRESKKNLSFFLGSSKVQDDELEQFRMTFDGLMEYLNISITDQLLDKYQYLRMKIYHNYRNILLREIIRILVADNVLVKMFNVKKYMCIFCLIACELLEEARTLIRCEKQKQGQRKNVRLALDRDVKRLRNDKAYYSYMCSTFQKILKYQQRSDKADHQAYYIKQDKQGKQHLNQIKVIKKILDSIVREYSMKLDEAENRKPEGNEEERERQMKIKYVEKIKALDKKLNENFIWIKIQCSRILFNELLLDKANQGKAEKKKQLDDLRYHKLPQDDPFIRNSYALFNKKLARMVQALCYFDNQNLFIYESIVIPTLRLETVEMGDKKVEIKVARNDKELQELQKQDKGLDTLEEIFKTTQFYYQMQSRTNRTVLVRQATLSKTATRMDMDKNSQKSTTTTRKSTRSLPLCI